MEMNVNFTWIILNALLWEENIPELGKSRELPDLKIDEFFLIELSQVSFVLPIEISLGKLCDLWVLNIGQ